MDPAVAADEAPEWGPYSYVKNNPASSSDPNGLCPQGGRRGFLCNAIEATSALIGSVGGFVAGGGAGLLAAAPTGELAAPITVPLAAVQGAALGAGAGLTVGKILTSLLFNESIEQSSSGGQKGRDNKRFLNQKPLQGGRRVSVDAETGGSGDPVVQVTVQGKGIRGGRIDYLINAADEIKSLPRALRANSEIIQAVNKALQYINR